MKKAFVIGNDSYQDNKDKLSNAINDAKAIKDILSYKGFDVFYYGDLRENDFIRAFSDFVDTVCEGDDIIFFFAGHAIEDRDTNYLFSIDYKVSFNLESSLTIDKIQNDFFEKNKSGFKLIVVDACRNNPVCAVSPIPKKNKANNNTLIAFSTSSGNTAKDGKGNNSIYTYHLINNIKKYGLSISDVFSKTRDSVMKLTNFSQIPWEYSSLLESDGGFTFDNISIPNQLKQITRNKFDVSYSATYIDGVFYIVGDSNEIYLFGEGGTISKSIKIHPDEGFRSVEKIASNSHALAFVSDSGCFGYINLTSNKFISYKFEEALFAVSINDDDVAILGGASDKLKFIDINRGLNFEMDLGEEVLSLMFKDSESLKYAASKLTIMTSCFSKKDKNIFAFGGSASVFGIIDVEQKKCLFANKDNSCFTYTYCVDFSHDGKYIVSSHESGKVNLWCAETYKMLYTFKVNECINKKEFFEFEHEKICNHMHHVRFLPNSKAFAVSTSESQVIFFDFCKKVIIDKVDLNIEPLHVYSFEFTSSGKEMVISIGSKHYLLTTKTDQ